MLIYLPYPSYLRSVGILTGRDLNSQLVTGLKIQRALLGSEPRWEHLSGVKMWEGYEDALHFYIVCANYDWKIRTGDEHEAAVRSFKEWAEWRETCPPHYRKWAITPHWMKNARFHESHQSALVRHNRTYYHPLWPTVPDDLEIVWPLSHWEHNLTHLYDLYNFSTTGVEQP